MFMRFCNIYASRTFGLAGLLAIGWSSCQTQGTSSRDASGEALFKRYCVNCHGRDGSLMSNGARNLKQSFLSLDERILIITHGRNTMTPFRSTLSEAEIREVAEYTLQLNQNADHVR